MENFSFENFPIFNDEIDIKIDEIESKISKDKDMKHLVSKAKIIMSGLISEIEIIVSEC